MWRHAYKFIKWCLTFCCNRCILTEGRTNKNHPGKTFQKKDTRTKNPARWENLYRGFCPVFCTRPTGVRDVWRTFGGGPGMCDKVWQRGLRGQNWPKIAWRILNGRPHSSALVNLRVGQYRPIAFFLIVFLCPWYRERLCVGLHQNLLVHN